MFMGLLTTKMWRNRIGQHFGEDNGSMVCRIKLLNQLEISAPIESLHNLIETLKFVRPDLRNIDF